MQSIPCEENMKKPDLLEIGKRVLNEKRYVVNLIKPHGYSIPRLPPYNADLSPIEFVWDDIKGKIAEDLSSKSLMREKILCEHLFERYSAEKWNWQSDLLMNETIHSIIITQGDDLESGDDSA